MAKRRSSKSSFGLNSRTLIMSIILAILVLGIVIFARATQQPDYAFEEADAAPPYDETISGAVWYQQPTRSHTVTLQYGAKQLSGRVKEGHPENGCTNNPDPGVHQNCDQNQRNENFDLVCNNQVIFSYRDRGPQYEEWFNVNANINLPAGTHQCQVRHINTVNNPNADPGSVDYFLTFVVDPPEVCTQVNIDFNTVPGAQNVQLLSINNQFAQQYGVRFVNGARSDGGRCQTAFPVLAQQGPPRVAFEGYQLRADTPAPGETFGPWFLTDTGAIRNTACQIFMEFDAGREPTGRVSLDIIDIHGGIERYRVRTMSGGEVIATRLIGGSGWTDGGNGKATRVDLVPSASNMNRPINRIEVRPAVATKTGWGWAIDNISFCAPVVR